MLLPKTLYRKASRINTRARRRSIPERSPSDMPVQSTGTGTNGCPSLYVCVSEWWQHFHLRDRLLRAQNFNSYVSNGWNPHEALHQHAIFRDVPGTVAKREWNPGGSTTHSPHKMKRRQQLQIFVVATSSSLNLTRRRRTPSFVFLTTFLLID